MSVSLLEVIEAGGYNLSTKEDALWLLSKQNEFDQLVEEAQELVDAEVEAEYLREEALYQELLS